MVLLTWLDFFSLCNEHDHELSASHGTHSYLNVTQNEQLHPGSNVFIHAFPYVCTSVKKKII